MRHGWLFAPLALALLAAGCGPEPYQRPSPDHEVQKIAYTTGEMPPGPVVGPGMQPPTGNPPAPQPEGQGERPTPQHIWVPGYYRWHNGWTWTPGGWWKPDSPNRVWIAGEWGPGQDGTLWWRSGYWR